MTTWRRAAVVPGSIGEGMKPIWPAIRELYDERGACRVTWEKTQ
jgi:hypothetical protein